MNLCLGPSFTSEMVTVSFEFLISLLPTCRVHRSPSNLMDKGSQFHTSSDGPVKEHVLYCKVTRFSKWSPGTTYWPHPLLITPTKSYPKKITPLFLMCLQILEQEADIQGIKTKSVYVVALSLSSIETQWTQQFGRTFKYFCPYSSLSLWVGIL